MAKEASATHPLDPRAAVELLAATGETSRAREIVRSTPGISVAYFERVLRLFAEDHAALGRLGRWARIVSKYGDDAALGLRALGVVERVHGRWLSSAKAFVAAGEASWDPVDRLAFQRGAIDSLARAGRVEEAVALAKRLESGLLKLDQRLLAARVRLNRGNALLSQDRGREARRVLQGVPAQLAEGGDENEAAAARLALSTSHLFGGDPRQARAEAEATVEAAERLELPYLADLAHLNLAQTELRRGRPDLALERLVPLRERLSDIPVDVLRLTEFLGDAYLRLNLWPEAVDAYREALEIGEKTGATIPLHRAHVRLGLGHAFARLGRREEACRELARAARGYARIGNHGWRAAALTGLAELGAGRPKSAVEVARQAGSSYHLARALLAAGDVEGAAKIVARGGDPTLRWRIHAARADHTRKRGGDPLPHHRRAFHAMLTERRRLSSVVSRAGYLQDKTEAMSRYIAELLSDPKPGRVREALGVVTRSRSATLLEEIVSAMPREFLPSLEAIREGLGVEDELGTSPKTRRAGGDGASARLRREWAEATGFLFTGPKRLEARRDGAVLVQAGERLFALGRNRAEAIGGPKIEAELGWLEYDLLAPMADLTVDPASVLSALRKLGNELLPPWASGVSPDGPLWRVPWAACAAALNRSEIEVRLHPAFRAGAIPTGEAMLWIGEHGDLPRVQDEIDAFLRHFPNARTCRSAGEARAALREGGKFALLHVAGHAQHRKANPMFSTVVFCDGALTAAEIARSPVTLGFALLSACETGRVSDANVHEPDGLSAAVLARGASAAIANAWPLDDAAGTLFSHSFYQTLVTGCPLHHSLAEARNAVRRELPHPYYWGSPTLFAGYRP